MKKFTLLLCAIFLSTIGFSQNLVVNGDMESWDDPNTPTGWNRAQNAAQSTNAHSGTFSVRHTGGRSDLGQTIPGIIPGKTYTISFWYQHETGTGDGTDLRIWSYWKAGNTNLNDNVDELRGSFLDNNNGEWTQYSVTLTAPATADNFYFEVRTYSGAVVYYDDFSLTCLDCSDDFDCPELAANIGDTCDDGNPNTINDVIGEDCECAGTPVVIGDECGFENFDNANIGTGYSDGSFVGNDGIEWFYVESRDENGDENNSGIAGNAIMLRRVSDNSKITSGTISGGIGSFSVKVYKGFTGGGNREIELFINGISRGTSTPFNDFDEHIFTVDNINIEGDFVLEIRNITSNQVIIDDITWTCYGDEEPVEYDCPALEANFGDACDDGDDMTENDMINENCECEGTPIVFDCPELFANIGDTCDDGNPNTINDVITADCGCEGTEIVVGDECGFENFDNAVLTASYSDGSFVGENGITWTYVESRDENGDTNNSGIDGNAIMLRRVSDNSKITSGTISGGIGSFSVKVYKGFTGGGNREIELFINGISRGTSTPFNDFDEHIFTVDNINIEGDFVLEIRNITSNQVIIDDITWTCYGDEEPVDTDGDGVADSEDNCPSMANADQADLDEDGIGDACDDDIDGDGVLNEDDCDPYDASVGAGTVWYQDADGDGFGNEAVSVTACAQPDGYVAEAGDCDDSDNTIYPGATEIPNDGIDQDCDGSDLVVVIDGDNDGVADSEDNCPSTANADQADLDGDGIGDACDDDIDGDGILNEDDCDPYDASVGAGTVWYQDADGDGFGNEAVSVTACAQPDGYVAEAGDCDDSDNTIYPGATEIPNDGIDQDCDGSDLVTFNCPELGANIGDACDDDDATTENDVINENCECEGTPIVVDPEECVAPTEVTIERLSPTSIAISTNVEVWSMYVDIFNNPPSFNSRTKSHWTKLRNTYINNNLVPNRTYYLWFRTNCPNNEVSEYTELYTVEPWAVARSSSNPNATINQVHEQLVNVDVFPNPTSDELNISGINAQQIRIFDSNGTAIFSGRVDNNQLNLRQLQTGVYRMVITDENNREHAVQVIKR